MMQIINAEILTKKERKIKNFTKAIMCRDPLITNNLFCGYTCYAGKKIIVLEESKKYISNNLGPIKLEFKKYNYNYNSKQGITAIVMDNKMYITKASVDYDLLNGAGFIFNKNLMVPFINNDTYYDSSFKKYIGL